MINPKPYGSAVIITAWQVIAINRTSRATLLLSPVNIYEFPLARTAACAQTGSICCAFFSRIDTTIIHAGRKYYHASKKSHACAHVDINSIRICKLFPSSLLTNSCLHLARIENYLPTITINFANCNFDALKLR